MQLSSAPRPVIHGSAYQPDSNDTFQVSVGLRGRDSHYPRLESVLAWPWQLHDLELVREFANRLARLWIYWSPKGCVYSRWNLGKTRGYRWNLGATRGGIRNDGLVPGPGEGLLGCHDWPCTPHVPLSVLTAFNPPDTSAHNPECRIGKANSYRLT